MSDSQHPTGERLAASVTCPNCSTLTTDPDREIGDVIRCRECGVWVGPQPSPGPFPSLFTIVPPPDRVPAPWGGGFYATYKPDPTAAGELVAVWGPDDPEPWHVSVHRHTPEVGRGQPCPWNCDWLPGLWDASVFPLDDRFASPPPVDWTVIRLSA